MTTRAACRGCGKGNLFTVLDLGLQCPANDLRQHYSDDVQKFPLKAVFCNDCALVQLNYDVPPEVLFRHYKYFSSYSDTMNQHVRTLVRETIAIRGLNSTSLVVEAASNDGYLLKHYKDAGVPVLGIEPAANVAEIAKAKNDIPSVIEFFSETVGQYLAKTRRRCDVFHAHNVFAHVPDPCDFLRGIRACLKDDGVAIIEAPYVYELIEKKEFDTIYHEHYSYFSVSSVQNLADRCGLKLLDCERVPIHGGSMRYYLGKTGTRSDSINQFLRNEKLIGLTRFEYFQDFSDKVFQSIDVLRNSLRKLFDNGNSVAVYGASAKGSTLLQALGRRYNDKIEFAVDRSPHKRSLLLPGTKKSEFMEWNI